MKALFFRYCLIVLTLILSACQPQDDPQGDAKQQESDPVAEESSANDVDVFKDGFYDPDSDLSGGDGVVGEIQSDKKSPLSDDASEAIVLDSEFSSATPDQRLGTTEPADHPFCIGRVHMSHTPETL